MDGPKNEHLLLQIYLFIILKINKLKDKLEFKNLKA